MATFKDQVDADRDNLFLNTDEFAVAVNYTAPDGTVTAITLIPDEQVGALDDKENMTFNISTDALLPVRGGRITYDGSDWTVVDIRSDGLSMYEIRAIAPDITS